MSYQIIYGSKDIKIIRKPKKRKSTGLMVCMVGIFILGLLRFSGLGNALWQYMIPGDPAVTTEAFQNLSNSLQNGESFPDAVFVFCETVIQGARLG